MRKKIIGFLIIPILLIAVVGCDLNTLSGLMGKLSVNFLEDLDLDTGYIDDFMNTGSKEALEEILGSNKQTEALAKKLNVPADPDEAESVRSALDDRIKEVLKIDPQEDLGIEIKTDGDKVVAEQFLDLIDVVEDIFGDLDGDDDGKEISDNDLDKVFRQAAIVLDSLNAFSSVDLANVDDIFGSLLDNLGGFRGVSRNSSRDSGGFDEEALFLAVLRPVLKVMDADNNETISDPELNATIKDYTIIRSSYESMARSMAKRSTPNDSHYLNISDAINYVISVVMTTGKTEFHDYRGEGKDGFKEVLNDIYRYIIDYDNNENEDFETYISGDELDLDLFKNIIEADGDDGDPTVKRIRKTLETILKAADFPQDFFEKLK